MYVLAAACLIAGILPGLFIDSIAPVVQTLVDGRMPVQTGVEWLSIVPIAESRSSYNGLLVFVFIPRPASIAAFAIHRLASDKLRRGPAWGCGYPDPGPSRNTPPTASRSRSAASSAHSYFAPAKSARCRRPAQRAPARLTVEMHDLIWDTLYAPIAVGVASPPNGSIILQFLTIRSYLIAGIRCAGALLLVLAIWP